MLNLKPPRTNGTITAIKIITTAIEYQILRRPMMLYERAPV